MKNLITLTLLLAASCRISAGDSLATFRNPVIAGYHPDPSICRVGDTFYLVNSSFCCFPGVPLFESKDLTNWTQTGNVLTRPEQLTLTGASSWAGIYAPTIRHHDGTFYMVTTNVGNGGNFFVTSTDARTWSDPVWLEQQGIDPSFFFEDGKVYFCSNPGDAIWLCEIDPETGRQLTPSRMLWEGDGGRYPEGPHIYKKDGYYYLLISEGGTELAHSLTIARSRDIYGPYESNPANPILTNCSRLGQSKQIQGVGHGDFVQAADGSWWLVCLAYRNFGGSYHHLGRETCLAPVEWNEGEWPVVNGGLPLDTLMSAKNLPAASPIPPANDCRLADSPAWVGLQNPVEGRVKWRGDTLRLSASAATLDTNDAPTFLGLRQDNPKCEFSAAVDLSGIGLGNSFGLTVYQINDGHLDLYVRRNPVEGCVAELRCRLKSIDYVVGSMAVSSGTVRLRVSSDGDMYHFDVAEDGKEYTRIGALHCSLVSTEVAGGFTGAILGMFATGPDGNSFADFSGIVYRGLE